VGAAAALLQRVEAVSLKLLASLDFHHAAAI
jgi:hypothetical protein